MTIKSGGTLEKPFNFHFILFWSLFLFSYFPPKMTILLIWEAQIVMQQVPDCFFVGEFPFVYQDVHVFFLFRLSDNLSSYF